MTKSRGIGRGGARPGSGPKQYGDPLETHLGSVRVSRPELEALKHAAQAAGVAKLSKWVRAWLFYAAQVGGMPPEEKIDTSLRKSIDASKGSE